MRILKPASLAELVDIAGPFLSEHEAEHGLLLGVAMATVDPAPHAYWALIAEGRSIVAAAVRTDAKLIVSREGLPGAMAVLAGDAIRPELRAVLGPSASVAEFGAASGLA